MVHIQGFVQLSRQRCTPVGKTRPLHQIATHLTAPRIGRNHHSALCPRLNVDRRAQLPTRLCYRCSHQPERRHRLHWIYPQDDGLTPKVSMLVSSCVLVGRRDGQGLGFYRGRLDRMSQCWRWFMVDGQIATRQEDGRCLSLKLRCRLRRGLCSCKSVCQSHAIEVR